MNESSYQVYHDYLTDNVLTPFYLKRINALASLKLTDVLKRKNPYLFKAKNIELAGDLVKSIVDAFLSSQIDQLKNISQIEHSRHRSPANFGVNLICGLIAYCHLPKKPSLHWDWGLPASA